MTTLVYLIPIALFLGALGLGAFLWALARENDGSFVGMSRP